MYNYRKELSSPVYKRFSSSKIINFIIDEQNSIEHCRTLRHLFTSNVKRKTNDEYIGKDTHNVTSAKSYTLE